MNKVLTVPRGLVPLAFTGAAMAVFFLVFWIFPTVEPGSHSRLTSELLRINNWVGSYDQRMAHLLAFVSVVALSIAGFILTQRGHVLTTGRNVIPPLNLWICLGATLLMLLLYRWLAPHKIDTAGLLLVGAFLAFTIIAPHLARRTLRYSALVAIGAYLAFIIAPGLLTNPIPFIAPNGDVLAQVEVHINSLLLPGVGLSGGQSFFKELPYNYGVLMPSIMSVIDHRFGAMNIGDQAQFVQYCQILFAVTATGAYFSFGGRNYFGVLVALLLAAPFWASAHPAVWHPNQSGFRSLTLPLGVFALALIARFRPGKTDWILGSVGGVALLINMETAVAVWFGFLIYSCLRTRKLPIAAGLRMAVAAVAIAGAYLIAYRLALGRLPFGAASIGAIFATLKAHTSGTFGGRLLSAGPLREGYYIVPFALVMFVHAIYIVIDAFRRLGRGALSPHSALRGAIAAMLVVWLSYYFNFPNWWQIWTHLFLYGLLLIDFFDPRLFAVGTALRTYSRFRLLRPMKLRAGHLAPIMLLAVMVPHTNFQLVQFTRDFMSPYWTQVDHRSGMVSGLLLPGEMADALKVKADTLSAIHKANGGRVIYLTFNVAFMPTMTRIFEPAPERSLIAFVAGDEDFEPVMNGIFAKQPAVILIDAPTGPLAVSGARKDFQDRVRGAVGRNFRLDGVEGGWEVWRREPPQ